MKHTWTVRRHWLAPVNARRRWDHAYQTLLTAHPSPVLPVPEAIPPVIAVQEVPDAYRSVCARLDAASNPDPNH